MNFNQSNSNPSLTLIRILHQLEVDIFGSDFDIPVENYENWLKSDSFFFVSVGKEDACSKEDVDGLLSILLTTDASFSKFCAGEILEWELEPFVNEDPNKTPIFYYSSFYIKPNKRILARALYKRVLHYFALYQAISNQRMLKAFSVPVTAAGCSHLSNLGFRPTNYTYMGKYPIYSASCSIKSKIWKDLLRC